VEKVRPKIHIELLFAIISDLKVRPSLKFGSFTGWELRLAEFGFFIWLGGGFRLRDTLDIIKIIRYFLKRKN